MVQRLVLVRQHRERRVVAHRADRLLARLRHRLHDELELLLGIGKRLLAIEQLHLGLDRRGLVALDLVELVADALDPLGVGPGACQAVLQLLVVDDAALLEVDQEHLAGLQAPLLDDPLLRHRQAAAFRAHDDQIVRGDDVARGPQPVAVERGADLPAVGEGDRRRAVPGLHHRRVVFVERAPRGIHQRVVLPRFRDHHHHRVRHRVAAHHQQLERVVEGRRVRLAGVNQRPDLVQIGAQDGRRYRALAGADPVDVAAHRVDLAVVADHAERMRQVPGREGVGRETLMHQRERRLDARVLQVEVVLADLVREQHALVAQGARRHRRHVELLAVLQAQRLDGVPRALADDVELALERVGDGDAAAAADEHLPDHRLDAPGGLGEVAVVDRHVAPAEQHLALFLDRALDLVFAGDARSRVARQEHHADAVLPGGRQPHAEARHFLAQEAIGNLDQQAGAVGELGIPADRTAVGEVSEDRQPLLDDAVRLLALDVRDEAYAAGVVLMGGVIKPLRVQAHDGDRAFEYTFIALQRQWLRVPAAPRDRRAAQPGRWPPATRSAYGRARPSCPAPSARAGARC